MEGVEGRRKLHALQRGPRGCGRHLQAARRGEPGQLPRAGRAGSPRPRPRHERPPPPHRRGWPPIPSRAGQEPARTPPPGAPKGTKLLSAQAGPPSPPGPLQRRASSTACVSDSNEGHPPSLFGGAAFAIARPCSRAGGAVVPGPARQRTLEKRSLKAGSGEPSPLSPGEEIRPRASPSRHLNAPSRRPRSLYECCRSSRYPSWGERPQARVARSQCSAQRRSASPARRSVDCRHRKAGATAGPGSA